MNKPFFITMLGLVLLCSLLLFSMTYTIKYNEVGIKTRFGEATDGIITEAGLGFKWPWPVDSVITRDKRLQLLETPLEPIQTSDGQQLAIRAFLLWKIDAEDQGPLNYYKSFASQDKANESLRNEFRTAVKSGISGYSFNDLIGAASKIKEVEQVILEQMAGVIQKGVVPVKVGFNQMSLPATTSMAVLGRMNKERGDLADIERTKGMAEAQRIQSKANFDADKIRAFANQRAEEIRAEGDALAATYLEQMSEDEELAIFLVWIDALENSLNQYTTLILETNVAPWHLMDLNAQVNERGIPQPEKTYNIVTRPSGQSNDEELEKALTAEKGTGNE